MSQITSTSTANSIASALNTTASSNSATSGTTATGSDALANESTFLKLLVAQLQNQDPLQPQDGMQFVSQLAQFSNLEQNLAMRSDLDAIKGRVVTPTNTTTSSGATTAA
ncbi:MAG: flagellar hook assembly protein FlgD [Bryobacteraceae bacterium]